MDVIVSPDARRAQRVPPGQSRTLKWPVLDASGAPDIAIERWKFFIGGKVAHPVEWNWQDFQKLPRVKVLSDFHCVTRWSRLDNLWEGVSTRELVERAGDALPDAHFALAYGYDGGWTTNMPLEDFSPKTLWSRSSMTGNPSHPSTAVRPGSSCQGYTPGRAPSG
jgi:DMSO/TMAO reductase YedYZ molybdopterin-dependent catalytic subunit